ncbi:hypothetical protein [Nocardia altamirensis]|uniref:hypothetical protein n=1 Tax=Nocardia altamirensis TaxID=472158 RepID=UPI0008400921|nr:hypothetical protein [Nocardia altamirensis]
MFASYVVVLVVSGAILIGLSATIRELPLGRRIFNGLVGIGFLSYAGYLLVRYLTSATEFAYGISWLVFALPLALLIDAMRRIDLSDVRPPAFEDDDEPDPEYRRTAGSRDRRSARRAAELAAIRAKRESSAQMAE